MSPTQQKSTYSSPEIKELQRQLRVLKVQQKTVTNNDRVISAFPVHMPNGSFRVVTVTKDGHIWMTADDPSGWESLGVPVPNTPAASDHAEIADIERRITKLKEARGRVPDNDDDLDEALDDILGDRKR